MQEKGLFNKFSLYLRRRIDYLSSVFFQEWDTREIFYSDDWKKDLFGYNHNEFIEETQKRALNELADMFSCELFYDDEGQNDLHKQLQMCEGSEVGATIVSYLSVKGAVSCMKVNRSGLFSSEKPKQSDNRHQYTKANKRKYEMI